MDSLHQPHESDLRQYHPDLDVRADRPQRRRPEHRVRTMTPAKRAGLAAVMSTVLLATSGCSESPAEAARQALLGTWELSLVSETSMPGDRPLTLEILPKDGWLFDGSDLTTDCGHTGPLGGLLGDWREVVVTLDRAPKGTISGSLVTKCITTVQPMSGMLIEAFFGGDGQLVGKLTYQVDRGNSKVGPMYVATKVLLFVARKRLPDHDSPEPDSRLTS